MFIYVCGGVCKTLIDDEITSDWLFILMFDFGLFNGLSLLLFGIKDIWSCCFVVIHNRFILFIWMILVYLIFLALSCKMSFVFFNWLFSIEFKTRSNISLHVTSKKVFKFLIIEISIFKNQIKFEYIPNGWFENNWMLQSIDEPSIDLYACEFSFDLYCIPTEFDGADVIFANTKIKRLI